MIDAIVTIPPYADFLAEVAAHPLVSGLRLNTVMPLAESPLEVLRRLAAYGKPLWVDLKGRQLRVVGAAVPPFTEVRVSHRIRVETPADVYFSDGRERARLVAVDGDRLILEDGPRRVIGPGESVNVVHASLEIEGSLTDNDLAFLEAMAELGERRVIVSYVEHPEDAAAVRQHLPDAELLLKIETRRGLRFAERHRASLGRLCAARGDLYVEVLYPHRILGAVRQVIAADPQAVVASRLFESLARHPVPDCADLGDAAHLLALGYRTFLVGDALALQRDTMIAALNLLQVVAEDFSRSASAEVAG